MIQVALIDGTIVDINPFAILFAIPNTDHIQLQLYFDSTFKITKESWYDAIEQMNSDSIPLLPLPFKS